MLIDDFRKEAKNRATESIKAGINYVEAHSCSVDIDNKILEVKGAFHRAEEDRLTGKITYEDFEVKRNKIFEWLIAIVDSLDANSIDLNPFVRDKIHKDLIDSRLVKLLKDENLFQKINLVWEKAKDKYDSISWIKKLFDFSSPFILNILWTLEALIPESSYEKIQEREAYHLIVSSLLLKIGIIPPQDILNYEDLEDLVRGHKDLAIRSIESIKNEFWDIIDNIDDQRIICEIIRSQSGERFDPKLGHIRRAIKHAFTSLLRLASNLNFGEERLPVWLFERNLPRKGSEDLYYWKELTAKEGGFPLEKPQIDNRLFRVRIGGQIDLKDFLQSLRTEFLIVQNEQSPLLGEDNFYIIHDETELLNPERVEGGMRNYARSPLFSSENYLDAADKLYNLGLYESALKFFEIGIGRYANGWADEFIPVSYLYHYIQTFNKLGDYKRSLETIDASESFIENTPDHIKASINIAKGISHLRLKNYTLAQSSFFSSTELFKKVLNSSSKEKFNIDIADSWAWRGITHLEDGWLKLRTNDLLTAKSSLKEALKAKQMADDFYNEYERNQNKKGETHYRGRYFGFSAFTRILEQELNADKKINEVFMESLLKDAVRAYGGERNENRNPFGIMSGRYCEASGYFYFFKTSELNRTEHLQNCLNSLGKVLSCYSEIYKSNRVPIIADKLFRLLEGVQESLNLGDTPYQLSFQFKPWMELLKPKAGEFQDVEIFTPLN
ncbi:MAG: hypothetical protein H6563_14040 [Lewinellaceae bacterium]|nr:hypothetical protein [Lewinellaceae bacterium]